MKQTFVLNTDDNRPNVKGNLVTFLDRLPDNKPWKVTIEPDVKARSDVQNGALFGVAYKALIEPTGFTADELHEAFCKRFFGSVDRDFCGQMVSKPFRTTTRDEHGKRDVMNAVDFARFYDMVQQVGAEAGIYVPDPDPLWREQRSAA